MDYWVLLNIVYKINIHLKSEVYIHLCQVYLNKAGHLFVENISCPMSDTVGLLFFKDVKCLSNTRENYLFQLLSTRAHANCSLAFQGSFGMVGSCWQSFRLCLYRWLCLLWMSRSLAVVLEFICTLYNKLCLETCLGDRVKHLLMRGCIVSWGLYLRTIVCTAY